MRFASTLTAAVPPGLLTRLSIIPTDPKGRIGHSKRYSFSLLYSRSGGLSSVYKAYRSRENIPRNDVDKCRGLRYDFLKLNRYSQCAPEPSGFGGRIGNPVRIRNGTATVSAKKPPFRRKSVIEGNLEKARPVLPEAQVRRPAWIFEGYASPRLSGRQACVLLRKYGRSRHDPTAAFFHPSISPVM